MVVLQGKSVSIGRGARNAVSTRRLRLDVSASCIHTIDGSLVMKKMSQFAGHAMIAASLLFAGAFTLFLNDMSPRSACRKHCCCCCCILGVYAR